MLYSVFLKGAPVSFILLILLIYVIGTWFYLIFFFYSSCREKAININIFPRESISLESIHTYIEEIVYTNIPSMNTVDIHLKFLRLIVNLSPLLGLLGTVIGIVHSTGGIVNQDQSELLLGISESLVTTAMGLIVSIPGLLVHFYGMMKKDKVFFLVRKNLMQKLL